MKIHLKSAKMLIAFLATVLCLNACGGSQITASEEAIESGTGEEAMEETASAGTGEEAKEEAASAAETEDMKWWQKTNVCEIYVRSFNDSDNSSSKKQGKKG